MGANIGANNNLPNCWKPDINGREPDNSGRDNNRGSRRREHSRQPCWPYEELGSCILGIFGVQRSWILHVSSARERQIPNLLPSNYTIRVGARWSDWTIKPILRQGP